MAETGRKLVIRKKEKPAQVYTFAIDKKTGSIYLRRYRSPFWGELPYVSVMMITMIFAIISYCNYIQLRTTVECRVRQLSYLQNQYYNLELQNSLAEKEVELLMDLDRIRDIAVVELGMVPVTSDHVILYERHNNEYVYQIDNIPKIGFN